VGKKGRLRDNAAAGGEKGRLRGKAGGKKKERVRDKGGGKKKKEQGTVRARKERFNHVVVYCSKKQFMLRIPVM
jgi:hypothetical protein